MTKCQLSAALAGACVLILSCAAQSRQSGAGPAGAPIRIHADTLPFVGKIDKRFQSFQIGMSSVAGGYTWRTYPKTRQKSPGTGYGERGSASVSSIMEPRAPLDLADRRLRMLAAALGPMYIRYSGTTANAVYFQDNDAPKMARPPQGFKVVLTRAAWKSALDFANAVNAEVLTSFTVSSGVRDRSGTWTSVEAAPWVAYTRAIGGAIYAAELFNEPNFGSVSSGQFNGVKNYGPARYARDFAAFRAFAERAAPGM